MDEWTELSLQHEYETNTEFKEYVDKYCKVRSKKVQEALRDLIVIIYLNYLTEKN